MKKNILVYTLAVLLVGCAHDKYGPSGGGDPARPKVDVSNGSITVDPQILVFRPGFRGEITWSLPSDSKLTFPDDGIVIEGRLIDELVKSGDKIAVVLDTKQTDIVKCRRVIESGRETSRQFTCENRYTVPGVYKYTIRVQDGRETRQRDPNIVIPK